MIIRSKGILEVWLLENGFLVYSNEKGPTFYPFGNNGRSVFVEDAIDVLKQSELEKTRP